MSIYMVSFWLLTQIFRLAILNYRINNKWIIYQAIIWVVSPINRKYFCPISSNLVLQWWHTRYKSPNISFTHHPTRSLIISEWSIIVRMFSQNQTESFLWNLGFQVDTCAGFCQCFDFLSYFTILAKSGSMSSVIFHALYQMSPVSDQIIPLHSFYNHHFYTKWLGKKEWKIIHWWLLAFTTSNGLVSEAIGLVPMIKLLSGILFPFWLPVDGYIGPVFTLLYWVINHGLLNKHL